MSNTYATLIAQGRANIEARRKEAAELARYKAEIRCIRDEERAALIEQVNEALAPLKLVEIDDGVHLQHPLVPDQSVLVTWAMDAATSLPRFLASPDFAEMCEGLERRAAQGANTPAPVLRTDVPASRVPAATMTAASLVVVLTLCLVCGYPTWLALALASASGVGTYSVMLLMRR